MIKLNELNVKYNKKSGYELLRGVLGYKLKLISKNSCSQYLMPRIEEILGKLKETVFNIEQKQFEDMKNIILLGLTSENVDFEEEFENDWAQVSRREIDFDRGFIWHLFWICWLFKNIFVDLLEKAELKLIQRKDIEDFFVDNFLNNTRKLEIHVSHKFFAEQNDFQYEQREKEEKEKENLIKRIVSVDNFKAESECFPSYY